MNFDAAMVVNRAKSSNNLLPRYPKNAPQGLPIVEENVDWDVVSERAVTNVVVIKFSHTRSFAGQPARNGEATGFVVDAERG